MTEPTRRRPADGNVPGFAIVQIVRVAWGVRLCEVVAKAAPHALEAAWDPAVDKEMVVQQAEVAFIEADALVYALLAEKDEPTPPSDWVPASHRPAEKDGHQKPREPALQPDVTSAPSGHNHHGNHRNHAMEKSR